MHKLPPEFITYWLGLCNETQNVSFARRALIAYWSAKRRIPGYDGHPNWPATPQGWSLANLRRVASQKRTLTRPQTVA